MNPTARIGAALLALALGGCHSEAHVEEGHTELPVTKPLRQDTELTREYVAQIHAIQHIELRALERGYLQDILVDEGRKVSAGQSMFRIMPMLYQAELRRASAETEFAQIEYQNTKVLQEGDVVSPNQLAMSKAKLDKAKAEQALAEVHLGLTELHAPFDGIMGRLEVRRGSLVEEGELLTTLSDNSSIWVYFNVSEREYLDLRADLDPENPPVVKLRMANDKLFDQDGLVETIEADFNNETGNIAFRATFPNPTGLLRHGETGKVVMSSVLEDALLIPQKATFEILDKVFVYVVDEEGVVHSKEIHVAESLPHLFVVDEGLSEDDQVLLEGLRRVRDGQEIHARFEAPEEVIQALDVHAE